MIAWTSIVTIPVGGLTEVGFTGDERHLLVVSHDGRGLIDTRSGVRVARDHAVPQDSSPWLDERTRMVRGIGPAGDEVVRVVGLWGGELPRSSARAGVEVDVGDGGDVRLLEVRTGRVLLERRPITEVRAAGFSPSGDFLVIATSSDVELLRRPA